MELVGLIRGEWNGIHEYISLLRATYWPHFAKQADGKIIKAFSRLGVSPIIPVSIIFPEKALPHVLGMIKPDGKPDDHIFGKSWKSNMLKKQIQSSLGLEDLPGSWEEFKSPTTEFLKQQNTQFHPFGIKRDHIDKDGVEFM